MSVHGLATGDAVDVYWLENPEHDLVRAVVATTSGDELRLQFTQGGGLQVFRLHTAGTPGGLYISKYGNIVKISKLENGMGQHYYICNLEKKQYLHPHRFGDGVKLGEICTSSHGTLAALAMLLADGNGKGGGDLQSDDPLIGSWAGDRIVVDGDYAAAGRRGVDNLVTTINEGEGGWVDISTQAAAVMAEHRSNYRAAVGRSEAPLDEPKTEAPPALQSRPVSDDMEDDERDLWCDVYREVLLAVPVKSAAQSEADAAVTAFRQAGVRFRWGEDRPELPLSDSQAANLCSKEDR